MTQPSQCYFHRDMQLVLVATSGRRLSSTRSSARRTTQVCATFATLAVTKHSELVYVHFLLPISIHPTARFLAAWHLDAYMSLLLLIIAVMKLLYCSSGFDSLRPV